MTTLEIVDAHLHLWDTSSGNYPWLDSVKPFRYGSNAPIRGTYLPGDYVSETRPYRIAAGVHVEADWRHDDPLGETKWLSELIERERFPTVCVGRAFFEREDAPDVIAGQAEYPFMRGIRGWPTPAASPADSDRERPGSMSDPRWREGYALLEKFGLSFDVLAPWWHLPEIGRLARDFPNTTIIINHTGYPPPDRSAEGLAAWRGALAQAAAAPNVALKISGLGTRGQAWSASANRSVVRDAIRIVGVERCMFASNFPPDRVVGSFVQIFSGFESIVADFPPGERRMLFHDNAVKYYRIPLEHLSPMAGRQAQRATATVSRKS